MLDKHDYFEFRIGLRQMSMAKDWVGHTFAIGVASWALAIDFAECPWMSFALIVFGNRAFEIIYKKYTAITVLEAIFIAY